MSKLKRAMFFKDKFLLDDKTVFHVVDVRFDQVKTRYGYLGHKKLYFIMQDMCDGSEVWHAYDDKRRKKLYVVVASLEGTRLGNGEPE